MQKEYQAKPCFKKDDGGIYDPSLYCAKGFEKSVQIVPPVGPLPSLPPITQISTAIHDKSKATLESLIRYHYTTKTTVIASKPEKALKDAQPLQKVK